MRHSNVAEHIPSATRKSFNSCNAPAGHSRVQQALNSCVLVHGLKQDEKGRDIDVYRQNVNVPMCLKIVAQSSRQCEGHYESESES